MIKSGKDVRDLLVLIAFALIDIVFPFWFGWANGWADGNIGEGLKNFGIGIGIDVVFLFLEVIVIAQLASGDTPKKEATRSPEKPTTEPEKHAGGPNWTMIMIFIGFVVIVFVMTVDYAIQQWGQIPNPAIPTATNGEMVLAKLGYKKGEVEECSTSLDAGSYRGCWYGLIEKKIKPIATDPANPQRPRNWPMYIFSQLVDKTCPGSAARAQGPKCQLDVGAFTAAADEYQEASRVHDKERLMVPDFIAFEGVLAVGVLAFITTIWGGISLKILFQTLTKQKADWFPWEWVGKIGMDTIFGVVVYLYITTNPWQNLDPRLQPAVEKLMGVGFTASIIALISAMPPLIGIGMGELIGFGKTKGAIYGFGFTLVAAVVASGTAILGLYPTWFIPLELLKALGQYPGMTATLAVNSVIYGGLAFSGTITTILGPAWTVISLGPAAARFAGLALKMKWWKP